MTTIMQQVLTVNPDVAGFVEDSRLASAKRAFVAPLSSTVGEKAWTAYVQNAAEVGATVVVGCEDSELARKVLAPSVTIVEHALPVRTVVNNLTQDFYGQWLTQQRWVGVTGTNGKTSLAWMVSQAAGDVGIYVGTLGLYVSGECIADLANTTPRLSDIIALLPDEVLAGTNYVIAVEVSSIGIDQGRLESCPWLCKALTNISRDHVDYHGSMDAYATTKLSWFEAGDCFRYVETLTAKNWCQATDAVRYDEGALTMAPPAGTPAFVRRNMAGAEAILNQLEIKHGVLAQPSGRMQPVAIPSGQAFVDYAHTPDALLNVLTHVDSLGESGRLVCVVGAGGNRDKGKRPQMARIALENAHFVVFTSDNPRNEDPDAILDDMLAALDDPNTVLPRYAEKGIGLGWARISDRAMAIRYAAGLLSSDDVLIVAGKGHETYQEINGVRTDFSDAHVLSTWAADQGYTA